MAKKKANKETKIKIEAWKQSRLETRFLAEQVKRAIPEGIVDIKAAAPE